MNAAFRIQPPFALSDGRNLVFGGRPRVVFVYTSICPKKESSEQLFDNDTKRGLAILAEAPFDLLLGLGPRGMRPAKKLKPLFRDRYPVTAPVLVVFEPEPSPSPHPLNISTERGFIHLKPPA